MSRLTIDELEMLNPDQLGKLLHNEIIKIPTDVQYIQNLITVGCPINIAFYRDQTALHWAAWNGWLEIVQLLVANGADIEVRDRDNQTPLHVAVLGMKVDVVALLISIGSQINVINIDGMTPWDMANHRIKMTFPELEPK